MESGQSGARGFLGVQVLKPLRQDDHSSKLLQVADKAAMQARRMLREADANGDGLVSKHEFIGLLSETNVPDGLGTLPNTLLLAKPACYFCW